MTALHRLVAVDTEMELLRRLKELISSDDFAVETFNSARAALSYLGTSEPVDVVVCGLQMPDLDGVQLVRQIREISESTQIVALADYSTIEAGQECVHQGAFSYLLKPFSPDELLSMLRKICEIRDTEATTAQLGEELARREGHFCGMVGRHSTMRQLFQKIRNASQLQVRTNILIEGESGTGKELVARAVHELGPSSGEPFVAVNCGAIPPSLLEDQLFGHVRGAFTGAVSEREGVFVSARGGTVFLDEVTEMSIELQVKLLRAVQEREVYPVGADLPVPWGARLICATNRSIERAVSSQSFRRDLYYRINVIRLEVPPLRERLDDVPALADYFLNKFYQESRKRKKVSPEALELLCCHTYPGNVRELQNALEYAYALGLGDSIQPADLPREFGRREIREDGFRPLAEVERQHIVRALQLSHGKKVQAAKLLKIDRNRLYRLIQKYQIQLGEIQLN